MKFKYYLRGAGIGIIVTTVILSAASLFQDNMSDAEIIQRAMELGMVMEEGPSGTLADIPNQGNSGSNTTSDDGQGTNGDGQSNTSDNDQNTDSPSDTSDGSQGSEPIDNSNSDVTGNKAVQPDSASDSGKNSDNDTNKDSKQDADSKKQGKDKEKITIKVEGGEVSRIVSQKIFEAGLVDDAEEFNKYLGDNGYASFLQPGTYNIKKGSSFQQIAEILTNK